MCLLGLENINEGNYRSITEFLKRHAGSGLQTSDYDAMLQSWSQVATGKCYVCLSGHTMIDSAHSGKCG
ncbi:hypothetical protein AHF37_12375 [Paragonimus kellicotti]|nr:hypothetical protein AHF37_12375 [Paragonimus kellicotti]